MGEDRKIESRKTPGYFRPVSDVLEEFHDWFDGGDRLPPARDLPESDRENSREFRALWCAAYCAEWNIPVPVWAAEIFARGWDSYEAYEAASLTSALGIPDNKRLGAKKNLGRRWASAQYAFELHHGHWIALKAGARGPGAFDYAAEAFSVSRSYVQADYYKLLRDLEASGELAGAIKRARDHARSNPDEDPRLSGDVLKR